MASSSLWKTYHQHAYHPLFTAAMLLIPILVLLYLPLTLTISHANPLHHPFLFSPIHHPNLFNPLQRHFSAPSSDADMRTTSLGKRAPGKPLKITNQCPDTIHPAISTQSGDGPDTGGFELGVGKSRTLTVSDDWQGRVWGRTNCSFNQDGTGASNRGGFNGGGQACVTGDCGGLLSCQYSGETPVTLAEFLLRSASRQSFYDISLVDGYNLPVAIVLIATGSLADIPPNLTNPVCIGTAALLASEGYYPYSDTATSVLGTNATYPLPFDQRQSLDSVSKWCPWNLQLRAPTRPQDGVYPYPDDAVERPLFNPCLSACAKDNQPEDCCTGAYNSPNRCEPSQYSKNAKMVCPDAYSFAYDDQTSTFVIPTGGGFEVVFCPAGRSTNILASEGEKLIQLAQTGHVDHRYVYGGGDVERRDGGEYEVERGEEEKKRGIEKEEEREREMEGRDGGEERVLRVRKRSAAGGRGRWDEVGLVVLVGVNILFRALR